MPTLAAAEERWRLTIDNAPVGIALVDLDGRVLGINIARAGRVETWTLPAETIKPIYAELKAGKYPVGGEEKDAKKVEKKDEKQKVNEKKDGKQDNDKK